MDPVCLVKKVPGLNHRLNSQFPTPNFQAFLRGRTGLFPLVLECAPAARAGHTEGRCEWSRPHSVWPRLPFQRCNEAGRRKRRPASSKSSLMSVAVPGVSRPSASAPGERARLTCPDSWAISKMRPVAPGPPRDDCGCHLHAGKRGGSQDGVNDREESRGGPNPECQREDGNRSRPAVGPERPGRILRSPRSLDM